MQSEAAEITLAWISGLVARTDTGVTAVLVLALALSAPAALLVRFRLPAVPPRPPRRVGVWRVGIPLAPSNA